MTKTVPVNILEKIRKLMRLKEGAEQINSEGEAYQAANAIHRLLTEYNLSMSDIGNGDDKEVLGVGQSEKIRFSSEFGNRWRRVILQTIAENNYCEGFIVRGSEKMILVGSDDNVAVCIELFKYLTQNFRTLANQRYIDAAASNPILVFKDVKRTWYRSYLEGCAIGLMNNFRNRKVESEEKGLMVLHKEKINDYVTNRYGHVEHAKARTSNMDMNPDAFWTGVNDGEKECLSKQIK